MPEDDRASGTPGAPGTSRPHRWFFVLLAFLIVGGVVLALVWKNKPTPPASSSPAASAPKHNANPAPKGSP